MAPIVYAAYSVKVTHHSQSWMASWPNLVDLVRPGWIKRKLDRPDEACSNVKRV